mgnify:CR=1 FL=1
MDKVNAKLGTSYHLFDYYGADDADRVVVCMGSFCDTLEEVIDYLNAHGEKVGLVKVRLYRPWSVEDFVAALPATVKKIAVLDRTKEPGSIGEPLYQDVVSALYEAGRSDLVVTGGRYGLGSKDEPPAAAFAVFEDLKSDTPKREFTIGIEDDLTHLSLPMDPDAPNTALRHHRVQVLGPWRRRHRWRQQELDQDHRRPHGQVRPGLLPVRLQEDRWRHHFAPAFWRFPDPFPVLRDQGRLCGLPQPELHHQGFKMVRDVKPGGTFLVNCQWTPEEFASHMPANAKRYIAKNNINVYLIDAIDLAAKVGMGKRTNTVLQSAFFALAGVLPQEEALQYMKDAATKSYAKKGQAIVDANHKAIDAGATAFVKFDVPADWADATDEAPAEVLTDAEKTAIAKQVKELMEPIARMDGDSLTVSAFKDCADGQFELGASAYEKRGVAVMVPHWDETKCIQCNQCAYVCPHATIRPFALNADEVAEAPETMRMLDVKIPKDTGYKFAIAVSPLDCMGCTNCAKVCPKDALTMVPAEGELVEQKTFDYCVANVAEKPELVGNNVKSSQFKQPLLEFSGSCAAAPRPRTPAW